MHANWLLWGYGGTYEDNRHGYMYGFMYNSLHSHQYSGMHDGMYDSMARHTTLRKFIPYVILYNL